MEKLKISIITVVKNGMPYLSEAISSFDSQTYINKEHIIVYSNSEDQTENFLLSLKNKKVIKDEKSNNKFGSLNLAIKNCSGDYIGVLHADDFFYDKETLSEIADFIIKEKSDVIYGNIKFCSKLNKNKIKRIWKSSSYKKSKLKYGWMPPHTSIFAKREVLFNNKYSENFPISGDYDFILKIFLNEKYKFSFFDKYMIIMRTGGDSTKLSLFYRKLKQDLVISKKYFNNYILCIFLKILRKINQFF